MKHTSQTVTLSPFNDSLSISTTPISKTQQMISTPSMETDSQINTLSISSMSMSPYLMSRSPIIMNLLFYLLANSILYSTSICSVHVTLWKFSNQHEFRTQACLKSSDQSKLFSQGFIFKSLLDPFVNFYEMRVSLIF